MPKLDDAERLRHNYRRMKILKALNKYAGVGRWVEFEECRQLVRRFGAPMVPAQLDYHLRFMADPALAWVELEIGEGEISAEQILRVRLRAAGVRALDTARVIEDGE